MQSKDNLINTLGRSLLAILWDVRSSEGAGGSQKDHVGGSWSRQVSNAVVEEPLRSIVHIYKAEPLRCPSDGMLEKEKGIRNVS